MTTELSEAQRELADTRAEIAELQGLIDGLEEKVRNGEAAEEAQQIGEQYGLKRLAELRQEAAQRKLAKAEAADLARRREAAVQAAREELEPLSPERLAEECEAALQVIERVHSLGDARQAAIVRHAKVFLELGMQDRIRHRDGAWVVFEVGGARYDTSQDCLGGRALLAAIDGERYRRALIPARRAQGFSGPEPDNHPMSRLLAANADAVENGEAA
ncbi:hypothetical protein [Streptomyces drozdowiczii]|uniref:hypothetical protein n=1 Tax=Streptomyces drozdowiczii TaxID=202862 RepID=UPI00403CC9DD